MAVSKGEGKEEGEEEGVGREKGGGGVKVGSAMMSKFALFHVAYEQLILC